MGNNLKASPGEAGSISISQYSEHCCCCCGYDHIYTNPRKNPVSRAICWRTVLCVLEGIGCISGFVGSAGVGVGGIVPFICAIVSVVLQNQGKNTKDASKFRSAYILNLVIFILMLIGYGIIVILFITTFAMVDSSYDDYDYDYKDEAETVLGIVLLVVVIVLTIVIVIYSCALKYDFEAYIWTKYVDSQSSLGINQLNQMQNLNASQVYQPNQQFQMAQMQNLQPAQGYQPNVAYQGQVYQTNQAYQPNQVYQPNQAYQGYSTQGYGQGYIQGYAPSQPVQGAIVQPNSQPVQGTTAQANPSTTTNSQGFEA